MSALPALGTLTARVQLQRRVATTEVEGGVSAIFGPLANVWARVSALGTRAELQSDGRGQTVTHSVVIRFRSDVKPGDRVLYRGAVLEVLGASDLNGRRAYLSCQCAERVVTA